MTECIRWLWEPWSWIRRTHTSCCLGCHFLSKRGSDNQTFSISESMRRELQKSLPNSHPQRILAEYSCHKGVWKKSGNIGETVQTGQQDIANGCPVETFACSDLTKNRGESCFFYLHIHKMILEAAETLEHREADRREARRDRKLTTMALCVAVLALIVSILTAAAKLVWNM